MQDSSLPTWRGIPMRYISLVTLTIQNSALILIMHYSRVMPGFTTERYLASTAVLMNELLKLVICVVLFYRDQRRTHGSELTVAQIFSAAFTRDAWKLTIPAALYTLQNNLQYIAVSNLDAATFQVTYQLKIITTAIFSVTMLRRQLSLLKWTSLILLTAGIALVQLPSRSGPVELKVRPQDSSMNRQVGLIAVVCACTISGLAGVYFEKVLKGSKNSLWALNMQLSFFSIFPALLFGVVWKDGAAVMEKGFFYGYNPVVWSAIVAQAAGGLIVALCVAYADNIMKNFATSVSILISAVASIHFFDFVLTQNFVVGAMVVLLATYLYGVPDKVVEQGERPAAVPQPMHKTTVVDGA
ncbi:UDP-galactose transporter [Taphrina deformans PYCC 5710]|uniref:UDP-galactose transporter n=1 Tax=Taphrina deformans (strain PYCC 5710 / ATCC 11124 / CBS 356.35 / IMI 108563 / JCM 9778 / NBRC 8474) TaxID=1097556 RepID=R4XC87_TAPDE|nr:UDP-galactose transporter [Taphrina deformans PYCC 5710]|eukprot:CCG83436.1 UDP-galactose transporter [Taphrina deformans PYCC 5710]